MIENKALQINVIFKKYMETQKIGWEYSKFPNKLLSLKTLDNYF